jgi:dCTP deaminase
MILSDTEILKAVDEGDITVDPFDPKMLNPVSLDLTLGDGVAVYTAWVATIPRSGGQVEDGSFFEPKSFRMDNALLDVKNEPQVERFKIDPTLGWVLRPGIGYLMHVQECIGTRRYVPILDGKSSIARLLIQVHSTAGFGDPGYFGQLTLEVMVQHPVRVYPGMRFCQVRFQTIEGVVANLYKGNYTGLDAVGAVASKCWRQFKSRSTLKSV